jgi:hypothetical protein
VLARLDAALDLATAEIASSGTAARRLRSLISRLLNDEARRDAEITVVRLGAGRTTTTPAASIPILALLPAQPTMITAGRMESRPRHDQRTVCFRAHKTAAEAAYRPPRAPTQGTGLPQEPC